MNRGFEGLAQKAQKAIDYSDIKQQRVKFYLFVGILYFDEFSKARQDADFSIFFSFVDSSCFD